jgi:hypothetical protein
VIGRDPFDTPRVMARLLSNGSCTPLIGSTP